MRIGTWNLAGRWTRAHLALLAVQDCDVWLLTEVTVDTDVPGYHLHATDEFMAPGRHWATVLTRLPARPLPDPHPASAAVVLDSTTVCASVLPWHSCGGGHPWVGDTHTERTTAAVDHLDAALPVGPLVWGGDWNHALSGREYAGSAVGRTSIVGLLARRRLQVPTATLPHRLPDALSIDHIAAGDDAHIRAVIRVDATGLSDQTPTSSRST